jgi:hypothetical protein
MFSVETRLVGTRRDTLLGLAIGDTTFFAALGAVLFTDFLTAFFAVIFFEAGFFAVAFFGATFFAGLAFAFTFFADFLAGDFFADDFLAFLAMAQFLCRDDGFEGLLWNLSAQVKVPLCSIGQPFKSA